MRNTFYISQIGFICLIIISCSPSKEQNEKTMDSTATISSSIKQQPFGKLQDGTTVTQYTLKNKQGMEMSVINYGGIITSLTAPDKNGKFEDIVLGFDSLQDYVKGSPYFGALVGRYGNRIAKGKFSLDGKTYTLAENNNGNSLHGGLKGFDKVFWDIEEKQSDEGPALKLTYLSKDMEEGFPGNLNVEVIYILTDSNALKISYRATTDKPTIVNLTQHTYFNLSGNTKNDILQHELMINADKFVPINKSLIPTGKLEPVTETPFDFRTPVTVGERIDKKDEQLEAGLGYDHCWVLNTKNINEVAATIYDPSTGRVVSVSTTEPGVQFYSGNFLDGSLKGKYNTVYQKRFGLCLETEHFPDSPNQKDFPSVVLEPEKTYATQTIYKFSVKQ